MIKYTTNEIILQIKFVIIFEVPIFEQGWHWLQQCLCLWQVARNLFSRDIFIYLSILCDHYRAW